MATVPYGLKIGDKLRKLRYDKGYSQDYLAQTLGVSQKTYSNMENNKTTIPVDTLKKLAEEYNIDLIELLTDDKVVIQHNNSNDTSTFNGIFINHLSEELMNQLKERIGDLKELIQEKNTRIKKLEELLESK